MDTTSSAQQLIVDIGNTSAKIYLFEGDVALKEIRVSHEELCTQLINIIKKQSIEASIISSVVPLSDDILTTLKQLPTPCLQMSAQLKFPFSTAYRTPHTLGMDRLAAATGAWHEQPDHDLLIIDIGTAITYDIVTAEGIHLGGNISPGIDLRLKALNHFTGKLPLISKEGHRVPLGDTTETAIREGVLQGIDYEIEGYIRAYRNKYPGLLVFLTGGDAFRLDNRTKSRTFADDLLVAKGLNQILRLNNETK